MKYFLVPAAILLVCGVSIGVCVHLYRTPGALQSPLEAKRVAFDTVSRKQFIAHNAPFIFIHRLLFGNRDKYMYLPPRVLPSRTISGALGYSVFGLVTSWNAETKLLEMSSYLNIPITIRFDPDTAKQMAFVPFLDTSGRVKEFGEHGIVTSSDNPKFATLFCQGDIVEIVTETAEALKQATRDKPIVPVELHLRQRLCSQ